MVDINKLVPKPNVAIPSHLLPISSEMDRKQAIDQYLVNIINWAIEKGYDPNRNYSSTNRAKLLKEIEEKKAEYKKRFDEVVSEINKKGASMLMAMFIPVDADIVVGRKLSWKEEIVYELHGAFGDKHTISATPEQICKALFDGIYSMLDANPLTEPNEFRKEAFEKLRGYVASETIFNSNGDAHTFAIRFDWNV